MHFEKLLLTGSAGFICSHLTDYCIKNNLAEHYILLDAGKTGSNFAWIRPYAERKDVTILKYNLAKEDTYFQLLMGRHTDIDCILNLASESHVDRSIVDGIPFVISNVLGTARLFEFAKEHLKKLKVFLQFSTDEVLGQRTIKEGKFKTTDRKMVRNIYSATKSCQEELAFSYRITHRVPTIVTRCTNVYGPRQFPEKFLPVIITKLINKEKIPVYGKGLQEREWVYVEDVIKATLGVVDDFLKKDKEQIIVHENIYHIGGEKTYSNIVFMKQVIDLYMELTNQKEYKYEDYFHFVEDRKGHDFRYDLDCTSTHSIGLKPNKMLCDGLRETIQWYIDFYKSDPNGWN